ncbi:MAG: hypothetical protein ACI4J4_01135 [Ruminiclostridium sp.]
MNKSVSRGILTILCGALIAAGASSCGNSTGYALTIDGQDVRAGIYILKQQEALGEASEKLSEENPDLDLTAEDFDLKAQTIEGIGAEEWIKNKTIEKCREYVATEKLFDSYGLSLSAEKKSEINSSVNSMWTEENMYAQYFYGVDKFGEYYESLGIGEQSYKDVSTASAKQTQLFDHIYGEGGTEAVSSEEIISKLSEDYIAIKFILKSDEVPDSAQSYLDRLGSGESFEEVYASYQKAEKVAEIEAAIKEAEEKGEEYTGETVDSVTVETPAEADIIRTFSKDDTAPSEDFIKEAFDMAAGEYKIITVSSESTDDEGNTVTKTNEYVVAKLNIAAYDNLIEEYSDAILHEMKDEEFEAKIKAEADGYTVTENAAAIKLYTIDKLLGE